MPPSTVTESLEDQPGAKPDASAVRAHLSQLDAQLAKLHEELPPRTLLAVFSGHGDMLEARRWMARQDRIKKTGAEAWTAADQQYLEELVTAGRKGVCFFGLARSTETEL